MKKRSIAFLLALSVVTFFAAVFVGRSLLSSGLGRDVEHTAYRRLEAALGYHVAGVSRGLDELYEPLEILADSFDWAEGLLFGEEWGKAESLLLYRNYEMLCFADTDGNIVSRWGMPSTLWNDVEVSESIQKALRHGSGQREIAFYAPASPAHEPQLVVAVPVLRGSTLTGFLCAGIASAEMDSLLADQADGSGPIVFAIDSAGNAVLCSKAAKDFLGENGFFENQALDGATVAQVLSDLEIGASGRFFLRGGVPAYAAYMPLGFEDWYLFALLPAAQMETEYAQDLVPLRKTVITQNHIYTTAMVILLAVGICCMLLGIRAYMRSRAEKARFAEVLNVSRQSMFHTPIAQGASVPAEVCWLSWGSIRCHTGKGT